MNVWGRLADVGLGAVFAAALGYEAVRIAGSWGDGYWQFDFAAGTVVCAITLLRRRDPARALIAGLAVALAAVLIARFSGLPGQPGPAMVLGLAVLLATAVRTLAAPQAIAAAAAGLAVAASSLLTARSSAVVTINGLGWATAVAAGSVLRLRHIRRLAVIEQVRRHERLELARELHDVVAHHITGVVLQAQAARIVQRKHPEQLDDSLTDIETASSEALAAMRRVVGLLRDNDNAPPGRPEDVAELVARFARHGPPVELRMSGHGPELPPEITSTVHRVVQEALTNVSRHAPHARSVTVEVGREPEGVAVEVVDDAPATAIRHRGGYGLIGLRERVEALGGTFSAGQCPGGGWSVHARLPAGGR